MKNEIYHFQSYFTGEIVKNLPELAHSVLHDLRFFHKEWSLADKVRVAFCWQYSRTGF